MNILVTGGAGFIGSNLCDHLLQEGHDVICIDNFDSFYDPAIKRQNISESLKNKKFRLYEGDIRDVKLVSEIFSNNQIDLVIHLAARAGVRPSIENPLLYHQVNVTGTVVLLEEMRKHNLKRMLFASSSSVYGNNPLPFSESQQVNKPLSPYAASKIAGELECRTYCRVFGFNISCLRFFTVYGPRQRPEMAISMFIRNISQGKPIKMFGKGDTKRDYTYIDDIVHGIMQASNKLSGFNIFNLAESQTITLKDLISSIEEITGKKAIIEMHPEQKGDAQATFGDISRAREMIGYKPSIPVKEGLERYYQWMKK